MNKDGYRAKIKRPEVEWEPISHVLIDPSFILVVTPETTCNLKENISGFVSVCLLICAFV